MDISPLRAHSAAANVAPESLAANAGLSEDEKIAEASRQFEAILLRQILSSAQKQVIQSKLHKDTAISSIYGDMITNQLADGISKSGAFGLAKTIEGQLTRPPADAPGTAGDVLSPNPMRAGSLASRGKLPGATGTDVASQSHE